MNQRKNPVRVTKQHPCQVCHKPDYCMAGDRFHICMRTESNRPYQMKDGSIGWLHPVGENQILPRPVRMENPTPLLDVNEKLKAWAKIPDQLDQLKSSLGVTRSSLETLGCVRTPYWETWAFPMRDGRNQYIGIRLRRINGEKWAVPGSHNGLFLSQEEPQKTAMITEGPTDTAAALGLGYWAIGRPSCAGGVPLLQEAVKHFHIRRVVIVSDLDDPGLRGATTLALHLPIPSAILVCPAKDLRQAINNGMNREMCDAMINQLVWSQP